MLDKIDGEADINAALKSILTVFYELDETTIVNPFMDNFDALTVFTNAIQGGLITS